jgi:hypothetical protein
MALIRHWTCSNPVALFASRSCIGFACCLLSCISFSPLHLISNQWISGSVVEGAPTEEPRPDASNARSQRPATRATGVSRALACVLKHPWLPTGGRFTLPRSYILPVRVHRCPDVPGRQVNAVWGRCPTACAIYVNKSLEFIGSSSTNSLPPSS